MTFHNLHIIDIAIIIGYLTVCLVIGFIASKKIRNIKEYALGSRNISVPILVGTLLATDIGAGSTVGIVEKVQTMGLVFILAMLFRPVCWLVAASLFGKNIARFKEMGCISLSDIFEHIYGKPARWIANFMALGNAVGIIALQIVALNYLSQYFLGLSSNYCAMIAFAILLSYSLMGGMRAVALTDVMQGFIFFIGIPLMCFICMDRMEISFEQIIASLPENYKSIDLTFDNLSLSTALVISYVLIGTDMPFIQRYLMANNEFQLKKALRDCFYLSIPFMMSVLFAGILVKYISPNVDPNTAFYYLIDISLPIGMKGFLVAGMLAVIMSTADSWVNTASVICAHDIVGKIFPNFTQRNQLLVIRASTLMVGLVGVIWASSQNISTMDFIWLIDNLWSPIMIAPLLAALYKINGNYKSFITSCVFGMVGVAIGGYALGEFATISMTIGVASSAFGLFGSHYWQNGFSFKAPKLRLPVIGLRSILNFSENQVRIHGHNHFLAGGLGIMYFISSIFLYNPHSSSGLLLAVRSISALLSLGLLFHERIGLGPARQKYLSLYYHIVIMVIFPLISGYMMLLSGFSAFWVVSFAIAIVMMNFMCGITMTALLTPLGLLGAHILWKKSGGYVLPIPASMVHIGFTVILLVITARVRHNFQRSMIEIKDMYSTMLAHQVMQPIAQVSMVAEHAASVLAPHVHNEDLQEVAKQLTSLQKIGHKGTELVNGLLMMSRDDIEKAQDRGAYYIQDVINTALLTYSEKQLARIRLDKSIDFRFNGSKMFMVEVIRNLISNSFKYAGSKAEIEIFCGPRALYIRDNGRGIEKERLPYIFDPTRNSNGQTAGTGFGLAFVKRVVDTFSCSIICRSELGKYTEFVIGFPRL